MNARSLKKPRLIVFKDLLALVEKIKTEKPVCLVLLLGIKLV